VTDASVDVGRLLCVGIRGATPGEQRLEQDLDACAASRIRAVILFDVDVPPYLQSCACGVADDDALLRAKRNIESPEQLRALTDHIRDRLGDDTIICVDQEGGVTSRLSKRRGFAPGPSAHEFTDLAPAKRRAESERQAAQLAYAGIDLNFAPCIDLALEQASSIIARRGRSFGASVDTVVACARDVIAAHSAHGIGSCLKHFPGHGSATGDTHRGMVDVTETAVPDSELAPYRALLDANDPAVMVMVAHVMNRRIDPVRPASLSPAFIDGLLRGELGFDGVVVTDSIDMAAVLDQWSVEEAAVGAIVAGADIALDGFNLDPTRAEHPAQRLAGALRDALASGALTASRVARSIARIERFQSALANRRQSGAAR
jgi:beta-N-acetylhexosaminidase